MTSRIHDRLLNWGREFRDTHGSFGRCRSIEHRYVPEQDSTIAAEAAQDERASRPPKPDMHDALLVNEAWKKCSGPAKKLLKWSFCMGRASDEIVARRCGLRIEALPLRFYKAVREIENVLAIPAVRGIVAPDNSPARSASTSHPASAATVAPSAAQLSPKEMEEVD